MTLFDELIEETQNRGLYGMQPVVKGNIVSLTDPEAYDADGLLPYGLSGIIVPVLGNPGEINKIFRGINRDKPWHSPDIYYLGNYQQAEELKKHFGIRELNSRDQKVKVFCWGGDTADNQAYYYMNKELVRRWIYDDEGHPRLLQPWESLDSILFPEAVPVSFLRCLSIHAPMRLHVNIAGKSYSQVFITGPRFHQQLERYAEVLNAEDRQNGTSLLREYYLIHKGATPLDERAVKIDGVSGKIKEYPKVSYGSGHKDDDECLQLDLSRICLAPYDNFFHLGALLQENHQLIERLHGE